MRDQAGTRARIQDVALELFTEQGYEATSLREIAERLGVTKAALYYHFKTKEDIVVSLIEDRITALEELIVWAQEHGNTPETRREVVIRYSHELSQSRHHQTMRFMERNQTAMRDHPLIGRMRERMMTLFGLLSSPDEPLPVRLRRTMAILALHGSWFLLSDPDITDEERQEAGLQVALELIDSSTPSPCLSSATPAPGRSSD
jgi:AcrR family transcriptional regulator